MSEWITDRLPTKADQIGSCVLCWDGKSIDVWDYHAVKSGQPWMPIPKPNPYAKPKRWTVKWNPIMLCWFLGEDGIAHAPLPALKAEYFHETAQRIADIYNEVMP